MRKRIHMLAAGLCLSCVTGPAANASSFHLPFSNGSMVTPAGSSDGAGLPGLPGGKGGKPGGVDGGARISASDYDVDKLYQYCVKVMDDVRRGDGVVESSAEFVPSDCVDLFVTPSPSDGSASNGSGKYAPSDYDEDLFSYCVDLLRRTRRDESLPGYKGKRRIYPNDFSPGDCADYYVSLEKAEKSGKRHRFKHDGHRGVGVSGGVGGAGGRAGRGAGGGSGGDGGDGVAGGRGGRGGAGGSSD